MVPSLLAGSTVTLLARAAGNGAEQFVVCGQTSSGAKQRISIPLEATDSPALKTLWVKSRIARLQRSGNEDDRNASVALACEHNILARGVFFVAWDEDEKVGVASRWLYQAAQAALADQDQHVR